MDAVEGRSKEGMRNLLDATPRAVLSAFKVPQRDCYQIYEEHPESNLVVEDAGLGIERTRNDVVVSVVSKSRSQEAKPAFYSDLCRELKENCDINLSDVVVSVVTNSASDWSVGNGRAQFIMGEL
jgi:hypothetical protein